MKWRRWIYGATAVGASLTALMAFAHTPAGRPLLLALGRAAGCPVEAKTAAQHERDRLTAARAKAGTAEPRSLRSFGFVLGTTTQSQVEQRMAAHDVACRSAGEGELSCAGIPGESGAVLAVDSAHLRFDPAGRLVAVDVLRREGCAADAVRQLELSRRQREASVGAPTSSRGIASAEHLSAKPFRYAKLEYRYDTYVGRISALNVGARGVRVREHAQWVPPGDG